MEREELQPGYIVKLEPGESIHFPGRPLEDKIRDFAGHMRIEAMNMPLSSDACGGVVEELADKLEKLLEGED